MKTIIMACCLILTVVVTAPAWAGDFMLSSPQLDPGGTMGMEQVFNGFGCKGGNVSPELNWSGEPEGTRSFAVTVYDPDAPTGSGWWHWLVFNIPASVHRLAQGSGNPARGLLPKGAVQSRTDFGTPGYGGACPPAGHGPHRYRFTIWALDIPALSLDADASAAMVGYFLNQHALDRAELTVTYGR